MSVLRADQSIPLYEQLKNIIKRDIINGAYEPGQRMPSEAALQAHYGVSRITVRRAVQELGTEGMLERRQGKGTFVTARKYQNTMDAVVGFTERLNSLGHTPRRVIHSKRIIPAPDFVAQDLQLRSGADVIELKRTLYDDHSPLLYDECYYPVSRFPGMFELIRPDTSTYQIIKEHFGVQLPRAHKRFNVELADEMIAGYLHCTPGEPLFSIYKITYDNADLPVQISMSLVLASRVTYVLDADERYRHTDMHTEMAGSGRIHFEAFETVD